MILTAADFADTGQWRLILEIGVTGLKASLENTLHPELQPQPLCSASWELNKDMLRNNIEEAVYANPRLLDDFATRIVLYDPKTLFIPSDIAELKPGAEEELYNQVYTADEEDIMTDQDRDITAAWCLAPGVKSFLMRTFPGSRITSNIMNKVKSLRKNNEGLTLYTFAREGEVDLVMLDGHNLISASTHEWTTTDDIAYMVLNLLDVYEKNLSEARIVAEGHPVDTPAWQKILSQVSSTIN